MTAAGGAEVANPLSFTLDANQRTRKIVLDDLIVAAGGLNVPKKSGFIVIDVGGDKKNVTVRGLLQWTGATPQDLSQTALPVGPDTKAKRALFVPFQETPGHPGQFPGCVDTELSIVYIGGIGHAKKTKKRGAQVNLFLFDDSTGQALRSPGGNDVCNPCSFAMGTDAENDPAPRKRLVTIEDLILEGGGFSTGVKTGFAVITLEGDADNINITSAVVNAKSSAFDRLVRFHVRAATAERHGQLNASRPPDQGASTVGGNHTKLPLTTRSKVLPWPGLPVRGLASELTVYSGAV